MHENITIIEREDWKEFWLNEQTQQDITKDERARRGGGISSSLSAPFPLAAV